MNGRTQVAAERGIELVGSDGHLLALGLLRACGCLARQIVAAIPLGSHHVRGGRFWDSHLARVHVPAKANLACLLINTSATRPADIKEA